MRLEQYGDDTGITLGDKLIGSDVDDSGKTKEYSFQDIKAFLIAQGLGAGTPYVAPVKTHGSVSGGATAPYPVLTYNSNVVNSNNVNNNVVLAATTEVGKEVLVFAANNSGSFSVMANQEGTARISSGGISSTTGSLAIEANTSVRFIHLNNGYWKAETI